MRTCFAALLAACQTGKATGECDAGATCEGCCVVEALEDTGDPGHYYDYADLLDSADDNASTWVDQPRPLVVPLEVDRDSIVRNVYQWYENDLLTGDEAQAAVQFAIDYWNAATPEVQLEVTTWAKDCCNSASDTSCTDCGGDASNDIFFWEGPSTDFFPSESAAAAFALPLFDGFCLRHKDVFLFTDGPQNSDGSGCSYYWMYPYTDQDYDCADGRADKPFRDTLIHELGHVLGLGGDFDPWPASAVSYSCDAGAGCSYDAVSAVDTRALEELYAQCDT